jgi:predicted dehydrogenase
VSSSGGSGQIRVGLIGLGSWAKEAYVPVLREQPNVSVGAVAARTQATRQVAAGLFGPDVELYSDYRDLLDRSEVGVVMVGVPPELTTRVAVAAVEADRHLFVEPPFAIGDDTDRLLDLAERSGRVFHADLELRYLPVVAAVRSLVEKGGLGRLLLVRVELENDWAERGTMNEPFMGSMAFSLGTWYLDVVDALVDGTPERMDLFGSYPAGAPIMQTGTASVQFAEGVVGEWAFNLRSGKELELRLKAVGTEGEAEANLLDGAFRHRAFGTEWRSESADCARPVRGFVGMRESVGSFIAAVRGEGVSSSGAGMYRRLHTVLSALRRSEQQRRSVTL